MTLGIISDRHGLGDTVILGIGMRGIPHIHGVGTIGAGILIGLGHGVLLGVPLGDSVGDRHTVPVGALHGVRHGAGGLLKHGDRQHHQAHLARIIM